MMQEREKLIKINQLAADIVKEMVKDGIEYDAFILKNAVENLARSVVDLTDIQLGKDGDVPTALKGTVIKTRLALNSVKNEREDVLIV
ncbi:hypothetical protein LCL95_01745 [Bacillus timonensis]|nr:hypothetical protein [Bacillus timonensis]